MNPSEFDIVILGGGLVGLTAANLFAQQGFLVALLDRQGPSLIWDDNHFDMRCSAISKGSQIIFQKLGVWDAIVEERVSPYERMHVWDKLGFGEITFDAAEVGSTDLGHIIENRVMQKALWDCAKKNENIHFFVPTTPTDVQVASEYAFLTLNDQKKIQAKLIIGADGGHSWLREYIHIESKQYEYHQSALVAVVSTELSHQQTAWQRFLPEGPLAFLPLNAKKQNQSNMSSIVWTVTTDKIKTLMSLTEAKFCKELAHAFDYRLGAVLSVAERRDFSLNRLHAKHYISERIALMGDAIHVIHPLAGQGVNLGLQDAQKLVETISLASKQGSDIGSYLILRKYERARKGQILATLAAMDFLNKIFTRADTLSLGLRSVGLNFLDKTAFLKKKMMLQAMGL